MIKYLVPCLFLGLVLRFTIVPNPNPSITHEGYIRQNAATPWPSGVVLTPELTPGQLVGTFPNLPPGSYEVAASASDGTNKSTLSTILTVVIPSATSTQTKTPTKTATATPTPTLTRTAVPTTPVPPPVILNCVVVNIVGTTSSVGEVNIQLSLKCNP